MTKKPDEDEDDEQWQLKRDRQEERKEVIKRVVERDGVEQEEEIAQERFDEQVGSEIEQPKALFKIDSSVAKEYVKEIGFDLKHGLNPFSKISRSEKLFQIFFKPLKYFLRGAIGLLYALALTPIAIFNKNIRAMVFNLFLLSLSNIVRAAVNTVLAPIKILNKPLVLALVVIGVDKLIAHAEELGEKAVEKAKSKEARGGGKGKGEIRQREGESKSETKTEEKTTVEKASDSKKAVEEKQTTERDANNKNLASGASLEQGKNSMSQEVAQARQEALTNARDLASAKQDLAAAQALSRTEGVNLQAPARVPGDTVFPGQHRHHHHGHQAPQQNIGLLSALTSAITGAPIGAQATGVQGAQQATAAQTLGQAITGAINNLGANLVARQVGPNPQSSLLQSLVTNLTGHIQHQAPNQSAAAGPQAQAARQQSQNQQAPQSTSMPMAQNIKPVEENKYINTSISLSENKNVNSENKNVINTNNKEVQEILNKLENKSSRPVEEERRPAMNISSRTNFSSSEKSATNVDSPARGNHVESLQKNQGGHGRGT